MKTERVKFSLAMCTAMLVAACGGGGGGGGGTSGGVGGNGGGGSSYTVGGALSGLAAGQSVVLRNNGGDSLTRSVNGAFTFATALTSGSAYAVTVFGNPAGQTCTVGNGSGTVAATNVSNIAVSCANTGGATGWGSAVRISNARSFLDFDLFASAVDVNETGVAVALWQEESTSSGVDRLWANVYRAGAWGTPTAVGDPGSLEGSVSVMPNGDAIVVYMQQTLDAFNFSTSQRIHAKRYQYSSNTWSAAAQVSVDSATDPYPMEPSVATDTLGNAVAVWNHGGQVWGRPYDQASATWSASVTQLSASPRSVYTPKIAADASNVFTAIWIEDSAAFDPSRSAGGPNKPTTYARRYSAGWGARQRIGWASTDLLGDFDSAARPWLDVNDAGAVFVVWEQQRTLANASLQMEVDAARFNPATGLWSGPEIIAIHNTYLSWPQVAVDGSGRAVAIWNRTETLGGSVTSVRGSRFSTATGTWGAQELIDQTGTGSVSDAALAIDGAGNAEVAWNEVGKGVIERRLDGVTGTWGSWNPRTPGAVDLRLKMSDAGHAVLIGQILNTSPIPWTREVWAWVYTP